MTTREKTWRQMSKEERLDLVVSSSGRLSTPAADRVREYFRTRSTDIPELVINVVLREQWREEHGNTREWDRMARAGLEHGMDRAALPPEVLIGGVA